MEAKYINPFIEAFTKTLEQLGITDIKRIGVKKKDKLYVDLDISTVICLKGGIQGNMALSMPQDTAKKLASTMMMGMSISVIDDMAKSAIGELSSMIAGAASTMFMSLGVTLQISPPIVLLEPSDINALEALAIDFETQSGKIELNIGFNI
ncbi:chemotaxis protein CheX [Anaerosolibacter carboniphilus]|uniref:Chemotaxis protein CheX n=1 Tax=Anaerosolibacter carboniphilus TaxID=1417629 RepID=A0A841L5D6_9FIRM|nr:chemotaxis protein CheX [Anaerosolibacter carboniphilus]MBB6218322.1 chemotaxis protein CheX [Anaerosolibacter carboniphilus]